MDYQSFKNDVNEREDILVGEQRAYIRYLNQHKKKHSMSRMENKRDTEAGKYIEQKEHYTEHQHLNKNKNIIRLLKRLSKDAIGLLSPQHL